MTCREVEPLLSPSLDEALDAADEARLRAHLAACAACAARVDRLRAARDAFRLAVPAQASRRAARPPDTWPSSRPTAAAAMALGLAVLALVFTQTPEPEPPAYASELVWMEFPADDVRPMPPCYLPSDCGLDPVTPSR